MKKDETIIGGPKNRRSFLKNGMVAAGAMTAGVGLVSASAAFADQEDHGPVNKGDIAILTFLSALEQVEADLWIQYAELGGPTPNVPSSIGLSRTDLQLNGKAISTGLSAGYIAALQVLDGDMPQYIADNTDDEISHHRFLNNYLQSKGAKPIDLSSFAILPPSRVTGVPQTGRLTNLRQLTVDTSWWTRYRSALHNPDLGGKFENAVPDLAKGQHPAIPQTDAEAALNSDGTIPNHLQAIAFTAGFHFAFIEQGGSSLYPTLALKVTNLEVLRILLSIGPSEVMHFQTWQDKAGNALPLTDVDNGPGGTGASVIFTALSTAQGETNPESLNGDTLQSNLIMPEPTHFLHKDFGPVAIIRPTSTRNGGAVAAVQGFVDDGLFRGHKPLNKPAFVQLLLSLAEEADEARRQI